LIGLKRIDHVGVVVASLDTARELLEARFGLEFAREVDKDDLRAVFLRSGDAAIELIEMKDSESNRVRLAGETAARLEHIALEVESLTATMEVLEALGIALTGPPQRAGVYTSVWTREETSGGVMFQFMEREGGS